MPPGDVRDGSHHEDAHKLSFADSSFDTVVSNEMLEHVNHAQLALAAEVYRVLRPSERRKQPNYIVRDSYL